jgi:hypothetical protein
VGGVVGTERERRFLLADADRSLETALRKIRAGIECMSQTRDEAIEFAAGEECYGRWPQMLLQKEGPLGWIVFNQPEKRDAVSQEMWQMVPEMVKDLEEDEEIPRSRWARTHGLS